MKKHHAKKLFSSSLLALAIACSALNAQAKDTVKIAFVGPLTGGNSAVGIGGRNSTDLAVKLANENPKNKYHYELVVLDDECKPNIGVQVVTKIASDKSIIGSVSHYCSAVAMSALDIYKKFGLPMITWGTVLPDITYGQKIAEIHRVNGTMVNQNEVAAEFMTKLGYKTWAILHDTTDYGKGHNKYFSEYLTKDGGKILGTFGVTADQQDFTAELTKVKELNPEVVYFGGLTPIGVRIRAQMERLGLKAQFEGTSGIRSDSYIESLGNDLAEGTLTFNEGAPLEKMPKGEEFKAAYARYGYDQPYEAYGPFAFAAADLIIQAIEKVGPNRKEVTDELARTRDVDTLVGRVTFDDHGQNIIPLITKYVVQDGKWVIWEESDYGTGKRKLKGL
ncbi:MAG: branched-chain amino acid ABC transporter substrate-binding protein [Candidatus Accumulibacter sp.]|jgi:branched-chain amino acid transport system substrate-binding protein|nr:branched-chain amino acid ABC transporter substrate-binding protein [Accumulibacter sp.]